MSNRDVPTSGAASRRAVAAKGQGARRQALARRAAQQAALRRRLVVASTLGALVVGGGVAYLAQGEDSPSTLSGSTRPLPAVEVDAGVVHVHGLGVDPADSSLYAATHSGLFRVPEDGTAVRVANRAQDTMGFSIVGPRTFIGSGHPDAREDDVRPPLLGLIESTDGGQSWERLSLHGKADFHALHAAHGQVYGYDSTSGTFMVSKDRKEWDRRSQLPMRDFVVSPAQPDVVLATTKSGLVRSTDGGRSWQPVAGAPGLVVLAWPVEGSLYGAAPDGAMHHSTDGGTTWTRRGTAAGAPEAITADVRDGKELLYIAADERGILASGDGGKTFTTRYKES